MITLRDALQQHIRKPGRPKQYRIVRLVFCTADRNRKTGGDRIQLEAARLTGEPSEASLNNQRVTDPEKNYRRGFNWLNFYDEYTKQHYKVHLDLIEFVNDLEVS